MGDSTKWEMKSAGDVAQGLDWLRRRMQGSGLVLVAVGVNSVAFAKDSQLSPDDAVDLIEANLPTLRQGFHELQVAHVTRGFNRRKD